MIPTPILAAVFSTAAIVANVSEFVSPDHPFGWLGSMLLALLGGLTLWRAGSVRAWKETAEARAERLEDVERQLAEVRAELAIPERIEGIIRLMSDTATRQDESAARRTDAAVEKILAAIAEIRDDRRPTT